MTIDFILSHLQAGNTPVFFGDAHKSLSVFGSDYVPFYVETNYKEICTARDPRFIIFSAPGASGKSALAKFIAYKFRGIYWDLSKIKLGDNTFVGTLWKAMKQDKMYQYWEALRSGQSVLTLDAFDEAEMISGRMSIQNFLMDIYENLGDTVTCTVFIFARTECADFIGSFFEQKAIRYSRYEIGFFSETNAIKFIEQSYIKGEHRGARGPLIFTQAAENCVREIFSSIKALLGDPNACASFLGYAPVLQSIEKLVETETNTRRLQEKIMGSSNTSTGIIKTIMSQLLDREQDKVAGALKERWEQKYPEFGRWDVLFTAEEQMCRIIEMIVFEDYQEDSLYEMQYLDDELKAEYVDVMRQFLPQHPFLQNIFGAEGFNFTGPAFRDYTLAYLLSAENYKEYALEYLSSAGFSDRYPSQLLFDFYYDFSDHTMPGNLFPVLYESFKAKERNACVSTVSISADESRAEVFFSLQEENVVNSYRFFLSGKGRDLVIDKISNGYIDTDGRVELGRGDNNARIHNTSIFAGQIVFYANSLAFETSGEGEVMLVSEKNIEQKAHPLQSVEFHLRSRDSLKVSAPNINELYKLKPYQFRYDAVDIEDYIPFEIFIKKLLNCVRCHSKDVPAKDLEFIKFVLIGRNDFRQKVMDFLMKERIFYIDPKEAHLYKMNTSALAEYQISWNAVCAGDTEGLKKLYQKYLETKKE